MTIYSGRYTIHKQNVYVAEVNGAVWDYKIIYRTAEEPMYMIATELITGETVHNQVLKAERILEEAETYLESISEKLVLIK